MKILVTGGFGFIGRNLTQRLVDDGHEVTVVTSGGSEPRVNGVHKILHMGLEGIDWTQVHGKDVVFHLMANNDTLCDDKQEMLRANLYGPMRLFDCAWDGGCRKFIYASSTAVYGASQAPYIEDETKLDPLNNYALSKMKFEEFAKKFVKEKKSTIIGLRYCNVYGPGEDHKGKRMSMVGQLLRKMMDGKQPIIFSDGEQKRDWVYVKDVIEANILAMNSSQNLFSHSIYNIGSGVSTSFNNICLTIFHSNNIVGRTAQLYDDFGEYLDRELVDELDIKYINCPFPEKYQSYTECNIKKAWQELGFSPSFDIESGIQDYVKTSFS